MSEPEVEERLEAHLRRTLQAVARTTPHTITPFAAHGRRPLGLEAVRVAAAILLVAGAAGLFVATRQADERAPASPVQSADVTTGRSSGSSLLTAAVLGTTRPQVTISASGWRTAMGPSFLSPGATTTPSPGCPGCGASRLVLADGDRPLDGRLFSAWVLDTPYDDLAQVNGLVNEPVMVGDIAGRAITRSEDIPAEQNRVTLAWPIDDGRTAFVDATGMATSQAIDIATQLNLDGAVPTVTTPPTGFRQIDSPSAPPDMFATAFTNAGGQHIDIYGTNAGVHGLLDWATWFEHLMVNPARPTTVDGATVLVDEAAWWPAGRFGAYWVSGDWGYRAVGEGFASETEFLAAIAGIELTDIPITATEEIAPVNPYPREFSYASGWIVPESAS